MIAKSIKFFSPVTLAVLLTAGLLFTQCKQNQESAGEEETTEEMTAQEPEMEPAAPEPTVIMVHDREKLKVRHKAKATRVHKEPEVYTQVEPEEVVQSKTKESGKVITYVPHRTTYVPWNPVENEPVEEVKTISEPVRKLNQFDTPPMYAFDECADKKHAEHCMHVRLQNYFDRNVDMSVVPDDNRDHVEYVSFVVKKDGTVDPTMIEVVDQAPHCEPCAQEAKRVVKSLEGFRPATWKGQPVAARVTLPVRFHELDL